MYNKDIEVGSGLIAYKYKYFYDPEHPLSLSNGCVYLHRHLKSVEIGRWLLGSEHVHHIDGDNLNNNLDNLQILSAEEHARIHNKYSTDITKVCPFCGSTFTTTDKIDQIYCSHKCSGASRIKDLTISKELLDTLIPIKSWVELGSMFGYTDNGIKKRAKALGCNITKAKYKHK